MSEQAFNQNTAPLVDNLGNGTHMPVVKALASSRPGSSANVANTGDFDAGASLTFAGVGGQRHVISYITWSYANPADGDLSVEDSASGLVFVMLIGDIPANGHIVFPEPLASSPGGTLTVSLSGATGTKAAISVGHKTEAV